MRMLRFFILFIFSLAAIFAVYLRFFPKNLPKTITPLTKAIERSASVPFSQSNVIFVPYWGMPTNPLTGYDMYVYFAITPVMTGVNTLDAGYKDLDAFTKDVDGKKKILAVRLLDQNINDALFQNTAFRQKVIQQTIATAEKYNFTGVAIDLEYPSLAFNSVTDNISGFINNFSTALKKQNLNSYALIYGDTFYRARPFNVKEIAKYVDGVFVMTYDFHKAKGNPGPNFPFDTGADESYSFQTMVNDFLTNVPKEKLTIVFGLFGYDWKVSDKGIAITEAIPRSTLAIEKSFVTSCSQKSCAQKRNSALEPFVTYTDTLGNNHIIWYEDQTSMEKKIEYLQGKGIGNTGIWAYSYF